jgi:hypothetical protein
MSLTELADLLGNMGMAVRTGPISGKNPCLKHPPWPKCPKPQPRMCPHCKVTTKRKCSCRLSPVISHIRTINESPVSTRDKRLKDLLKFQTAVLGLIVSKQTKKCIGSIDYKGAITHCDAEEAIGPYNILIKPTTNDTIATRHPSERVLGQCVDNKGKTIAEIVRKNHKNRISLTKGTKSKAPVIAVIMPSITTPEAYERTDSLDTLVRESKALLDQ